MGEDWAIMCVCVRGGALATMWILIDNLIFLLTVSNLGINKCRLHPYEMEVILTANNAPLFGILMP